MRVIAGTKRSLPLKTIPGDATRPTSDRYKETLFNVLTPYLPGARFLDLFAGSGQIGIEALSRGAESAVFVESSRDCVRVINENLAFTRLADDSTVIGTDVFSALRGSLLAKKGPYDIIFMDPPYNMQREGEVLTMIRDNKLLADDGQIVIESLLKRDLTYIRDSGFEIIKTKEYKTNQHIFLMYSK